MKPTEIGRRVRADRRAAGLTLAEVGLRAGLHESTISKIESGARRMTRSDAEETIVKIAEALGQDPVEYLHVSGHRFDEPFDKVLAERADLDDNGRAAVLAVYERLRIDRSRGGPTDADLRQGRHRVSGVARDQP